jgi:Lipopolysaccharide-assembly
MNRRLTFPIIALTLALTLCGSCGIYSFTSGKPKDGIKTFTVELFENKAALINPSLAVDVTEKLKDVFIGQSNLRLSNFDGDLNFEGTIVQYDVRPIAIQGNETAASNRLTVSLKVKYTVEKYPEDSWEKSFSQFADFPSTQNLSEVESTLVKDIVSRLCQDIFNKALSNW